ncbi:MAG: LacI family transcriptional regulator [Clostridia bacterium]|nr:LacI family transcriptional regulator [Clostridia bacterium]
MVTLRAVAQASGVSVATASRALNGLSNVDPAKAQMIRDTAASMGYVPNAAALSLRRARSGNIGILYDDEIFHDYYALLLNELRVETEKAGYDMSIVSRIMEEGGSFYSHALSRNLDGVVIMQADFRSAEIVRLANSEVPAVIVDCDFKDCNVVLNANTESMEELVDRAYRLGHRRLAFIHGQHGNATDTRLSGFYKGCAEHGLTVGRDYVIQGVFHDKESATEATGRLLDLPEPPTCIFYPDDTCAIWGMKAMKARGLKIGRDISAVGYDGIRMAEMVEPTLATWKQDYRAIARRTVEILCYNIENPGTKTAYQVCIRGCFQPGESLGPVSP